MRFTAEALRRGGIFSEIPSGARERYRGEKLWVTDSN